MAKHALSDVDGFVGRTDLFWVEPSAIVVVDGWNPRTDFSGEEDLVAYLMGGGVVQPLKVRKTAGKVLELVDGERRLRAVRRANAEGAEIKKIPVIVASQKESEADLLFDAVARNNGKPLTPVEEAAAFRRLQAWGFPVQQIAERVGKSVALVRNRLELASASPALQQAVADGDVSVTEAQTIVKESGGSIDRQNAAAKAPRKPYERRNLVARLKGGVPHFKGVGGHCAGLERILRDDDLLSEIYAQGYDPATIKITIEAIK